MLRDRVVVYEGDIVVQWTHYTTPEGAIEDERLMRECYPAPKYRVVVQRIIGDVKTQRKGKRR